MRSISWAATGISFPKLKILGPKRISPLGRQTWEEPNLGVGYSAKMWAPEVTVVLTEFQRLVGERSVPPHCSLYRETLEVRSTNSHCGIGI